MTTTTQGLSTYEVGDVMLSSNGDFYIITEISQNSLISMRIVTLKKLEKKYIDRISLGMIETRYVKLHDLLKNVSPKSAALSDVKRKYKRYKKHADELFNAVDFIEDELINSGFMPKDYKKIDQKKS
jgi:hypothetical protein